MKKIGLTVALLLSLAACDTAMDSGMSEGMDMADSSAVTQFFGKELVADNGNTFIFNTDGTVSGNFAGQDPIVGTYEATATEVCSTYSAPESLVGREFCSTPMVEGDSVVFKRRDGSFSPRYMIKG